MVVVGWFQIVVGVGMAGLWVVLLLTHQVPQLAEGRRDIVFHIGAELITAIVLVAAGVALLTAGTEAAVVLAGVAAGALLYTTVNSPGYYADLGQWPAVAMFGVLTAATTVTVVVLLTTGSS